MADGGLSCPLCLTANDPADMLGVAISHSVPVADALIGLCRRCVLAIVKSAMAAEFITPEEIFGDRAAEVEAPQATQSEDPSNARLDGLDEPGFVAESDSSPARAEASGALVLTDSAAAEKPERTSGRVKHDA